MPKWVKATHNDLFNLDNISHLWIDKNTDGYVVMGEMMHNQEPVNLSYYVSSLEEARLLLKRVERLTDDDSTIDFT